MKRIIAVLCLCACSLGGCGAVDDSSSKAVTTAESVETQESTAEKITEISVQKQGNPADDNNFWDITDECIINTLMEKINKVISDDSEKTSEPESGSVANGTELYTLTDSNRNDYIIRNITGNGYNICYGKDNYYEASESEIEEIITLIRQTAETE